MTLRATFSSEAMLCATFLAHLPGDWKAYPESCGFDIVLSRVADGAQIGIEAKLTLNAKVIEQITEPGSHYRSVDPGPDFRAVLVPFGSAGGLSGVCHIIGVTVIEMHSKATWESMRWRKEPTFKPTLPPIAPRNDWWEDRHWHDFAPTKQLQLPAYVPDVRAGRPAPLQLTEWKIKAMRMAILVERRGYVTREDFKALALDHRRWIERGGWLEQGPFRGQYVATVRLQTFRRQHPRNYAEIEADFEKWNPDKAKAT